MANDAYTDKQFDTAIKRTQRSDWTYVVIRTVMLGVVFTFMARAIVVHGLTAGYLLLPLAFEFVLMMWVGMALKQFVVDCPDFASTAKFPMVVFWTLLVIGLITARLAWNAEAESFQVTRIGPGWRTVGREVVASGLIWALFAELVGLISSTVPEVRRWQRVGGKFIWTSIFGLSMRLAAMMLAGFLSLFLFGEIGDWLMEDSVRRAWTVYGFLVLIEAGGLVLAVMMHREALAESTAEGVGPD